MPTAEAHSDELGGRTSVRIAAAILAAGSGTRFGGDKTLAQLGRKPVWRWSYDALSTHPEVELTFVVAGANFEEIAQGGVPVIPGGATRSESSLKAIDHAAGFDVLLIHDAARPFLTPELIDRVVLGIHEVGAAAAAVPVVDTIRTVDGQLLDRDLLRAMQTPQGARLDLLRQIPITMSTTDDAEALRALGHAVQFVSGDPGNFKITTMDDLQRARQMIGSETRTGYGYDIHRFSEDPARTLFLGGVSFPGERALEGHSDADAPLHALADAILGAACLGDIGVHFPPSDDCWKGARSTDLLKRVGELVRAAGWEIAHVDLTIVAERPKVQARAGEMKVAISNALGLGVDRISIKATTNEGLGSLGRSEGIASMAVATLKG